VTNSLRPASWAHRSWAVLALVALSCVLGGLAPTASATRLRRLAASTTGFASDGARYVVWQTGKAPIVVLDTRTGHRSEIADGCSLEGHGDGAGGRFLVGCGQAEALLNVRTNAIAQLPRGEDGSTWWRNVGLRYVSGPAGPHARCQKTKPHEGCTALYDIATGVVSEFPESKARDLNRPGAPPVCRALQPKLFTLQRTELTGEFSYGDGLLAHVEHVGEAPATGLRIDRCRGRPTILHTRPYPLDLELRGGFLTWDATMNPLESPGEAEELEGTRGTLNSYRFSSRQRRSWTLPRVPIALEGLGLHAVGVSGYSAHTDYTVFWIAAQTVACGQTGCGTSSGSRYYIYAAPIA
jgi:hypothetical protein